MRLQSITLQNMRLIGADPESIQFSSGKNVAILLGNNGCGKTSILDSIAFISGAFLSQFPMIPDRLLSEWDVHQKADGHSAPYLSVEATFKVADDQSLTASRYRKGTGKAPESTLKELKSYAAGLKQAVIDGEPQVKMPVFAYYGTGRGQITAPERKRNFQKVFERWDCYKSALQPATDFKSFFAWFDLMEDEERREGKVRRDYDYRLPALEAVRRALSNFVGNRMADPRIELHPLRFVMTERDREGNGNRTLRIEQMSDGYKIVIAMVADIASRMAEANPDMDDPLLSEGIIMIDEIDLHLHPLWQRNIIRQLANTFPNVQFIVTTHSPIVVAGAADIADVIPLSGGCSDEQAESTDISLMDIGQILLSDLFGLKSLRSPKWDNALRRRNDLLAKSELSPEEQSELEYLDAKLADLEVGETSDFIRANKLLAEIAKKLGING